MKSSPPRRAWRPPWRAGPPPAPLLKAFLTQERPTLTAGARSPRMGFSSAALGLGWSPPPCQAPQTCSRASSPCICPWRRHPRGPVPGGGSEAHPHPRSPLACRPTDPPGPQRSQIRGLRTRTAGSPLPHQIVEYEAALSHSLGALKGPGEPDWAWILTHFSSILETFTQSSDKPITGGVGCFPNPGTVHGPVHFTRPRARPESF